MANTIYTITKEEYGTKLADFIRKEMANVPAGKKDLRFWTNFNQVKKHDFDEQLAAEGIVVE
jgi:hypothetical protein